MWTASKRILLTSTLHSLSCRDRVREMMAWYESEMNVDLTTIYCLGQVFLFVFLSESDHRHCHSQFVRCSHVLHDFEPEDRVLLGRHFFHGVFQGSELDRTLPNQAVFWNSRIPHDPVFRVISVHTRVAVGSNALFECRQPYTSSSNEMAYKDRTCLLTGISSLLNQMNPSYSEQVETTVMYFI